MKFFTTAALAVTLILAFGFRSDSNVRDPGDKTWREVNVEGRYSMMLPDYLTPGNDLNDEATLQYQNIYKEVYIIVIDEPKDDFKKVFSENGDYDFSKGILVNYASAQMESIKGDMSTVTKENLRTLETGCGTAIVYDVAGTQDGIDDPMGFSVEFVEGRLNVYMIMTWTFAATKSTYQSDMDSMLISFKELSGAIAGEKKSASINVPPTFDWDSLYSTAILSFVNQEKQVHVGVYKDSFYHWDSLYEFTHVNNLSLLDYYTQEQIKQAKSNFKVFKSASDPVQTRINGMDAQKFVIYAQPDNATEEMFYKMCCFQGKEGLYLVETWTPTSKRVANEQLMNEIIDSFQETH